ncbi:MAG: ROK family protein [Clostridia bacterium]|nr:ROK family protein [Clostridia bacterium]
MLDIGFDIGGTTVKAGALKNGRVLKKAVYPTPFGDPDALIALIRRAAEELCAGEPVAALGVTVPGSVSKDGGIIDAWNIGVRDLPLKTLLKGEVAAERYIVRNDADAAAVAELHAGALKGVKTGLMLTLGTGVGGSLILNGELFTGGLGRGTEPGHAMLDRGGIKCGCGHSGCIETLCSATALKRLAEAACQKGSGMIYLKHAEGAKVDAKLAIECALAGDETALAVFAEYTDALADAIASFVNVIDPEVIVIGGGVSGAGEFLLDILREKVPPRTFFGSCGRIAAANAGNDAGLIGAVM